MAKRNKILCIGEVLWDALPSGLFLGGAPLNVCYHLNQLGEHSQIISRVGNGRLGREAVRRIKMMGISTELVQYDEQHETGFVEVRLDEDGNPDYKIIEPVAWDNLALTEKMKTEVSNSWAMVYGSLALRNEESRETINELLDNNIKKVFDINLREPFYDQEVIKESLITADIVKLNEDELRQLISWFSLEKEYKKAVESIVDLFSCEAVAVTRGAEGAMFYHDRNWAEHKGFRVEVKDAVGAGDAFLAALIQGIRMEKNINETLIFANAAGAYVASQFGATPEYTYSNIEELIIKRDSNSTLSY